MLNNSKGTILVFKIERRDKNNNIRENKICKTLEKALMNAKQYS